MAPRTATLRGDGIGPEVMACAERALTALGAYEAARERPAPVTTAA